MDLCRARVLNGAAVLVAALAGPAQAAVSGPLPYASFADSPFGTASFAWFHLEDFEDGQLDTPGATASGGVILGPGPQTDSVDADDGAIDGFGTAGRSWYSQATLNAFTFSFDATVLGRLPTHAGIVWTDVGFVTNGTDFEGPVLFTAFDAGGASLGTTGGTLGGDGSVNGLTAEDRFFGAIHPIGISRITIEMPDSVDWEVDHLQYGAVPLPGGLALLASGLALVAAGRRRRGSAAAQTRVRRRRA